MNNLLPSLSLKRRYRRETRLRWYGRAAIFMALAILGILIISLLKQGYSGFWYTQIALPIHYNPALLTENGHPKSFYDIDFQALTRQSLRQQFPEVQERKSLLALYRLLSKGAGREVANYYQRHPEIIGQTVTLRLTAASEVDLWRKGQISLSIPEPLRKLKNNHIHWLETLHHRQALHQRFNLPFFLEADSREPELAGIGGALIGSLLTITICLSIALPLSVLTAIYLEEFAPKHWLTELIEVNLNNLAAIPSIVFGLLGLALFLGILGIPRSSAVGGGLTLALMVLPTLVITTRHAIQAIPPSIKQGALALGASPLQVTLHHTLPLALPGIMTGTILSIARALGETAPLLLIGMVAFIADIPHHFLDPMTAMPVQIFLWADSAEPGFVEKTSTAILVLLVLLALLNACAIWIRNHFEQHW